jgi:pimeloyl-ACP methyl ester carboxylesterase
MKNIKFLFILVTLFLNESTFAKTYILVHGAMTDGTAWYKIVKPLESEGNKVVVINLPSHGKDATKISEVNYNRYLSVIKDSVNAQNGKVILVGHSMAGLLISSIADIIPEKIEALIYVAAFIPKSGESVFKLNGQDAKSKFGANIVMADDKASATLKLDKIKDVFCNDCNEADIELLKLSHKSQPLSPLAEEIILSDKNLDQINKYVIQTRNDNAITFEFQKRNTERAKNVKKVFVLESGHSPFISKPKELATILLSI